MKQSNTDYRHTSHFSHGTGYGPKVVDETSSLNVDPTINTKINENPYRQNVEIEKDELVLKPDMRAIHKAGGKKHSQGGTGVFLEPNSFVFSDDKSLAVTSKEHELFELEQGGKFKTRKHTPAKVLERNVDLKHYNELITIINDPKKDEIAKRSSALMLEKYLQTIGNVAYIQEAKKDFPQGIPDFALGTAPVYAQEKKDEIMENKQYARYGGAVEGNPYLPKAQMGQTFSPYPPQPKGFPMLDQMFIPMNDPNAPTHRGDKHKSRNPVTGEVSNNWNRADNMFPDLRSYGDAVGYPSNQPYNPSYIQQFVKDKYPDLVNKYHTMYGMPNKGREVDGDLGVRWMKIAEEIRNMKVPEVTTSTNTNTTQPPSATPRDPLTPIDPTGNAQNGIPVNWKFTPWQKQSQLYQGLKWAGVSREMPMRSRFNATYMDPQLLNPEQNVADSKSIAYQQMQAANILSPVVGNAQKASAYGQFLSQSPAIRSQYDNQNVGIVNQARQFNTQIKNNETAVNMQNDQQYWQDAAKGRQNFKNMRGFMADQFMNNRMQDVQDNQSLAYKMLTLGPKPAYGFDWDTGNFLRNDKNILDVQGSKGDMLNEYLQKISGDWDKMDTKDRINLLKVITAKGFTPTMGKKGGKMGRNPYK